MRDILFRDNREVLQQFAWSNVLLAFDYDGTLSPIVSNPERAAMRSTTRRLLDALAKLYPCMIISGRAQRDAMRRLQGIGVHKIIGNHSAEAWQRTNRPVNKIDRWRHLLEERLAGLRGVKIEDKGFSIAIHYRQSREKKLARSAILEAVTILGDVRLIGGNQVVNILPHDAPHKGIALKRERAFMKCDTAIYVGDDETDEDVFVLDQPGQLLTIRVGQRRNSAAAYFIENQRKIDDLIRVLLKLRPESHIAQPAQGGP